MYWQFFLFASFSKVYGFLHPQLHVLAEGGKGEPCHLEMLLSEGDADDGDIKKDAEDDVAEPCPQTTEDEPKDVQGDADATRWAVRLLHRRTERPEA